jgi:hypothetical protein
MSMNVSSILLHSISMMHLHHDDTQVKYLGEVIKLESFKPNKKVLFGKEKKVTLFLDKKIILFIV